ncbi:MAG: DUF554 domain-containing protein [Armatimonadetes bacterium]|nr:DUF554 domain-containing protein [Armatimonadota bacterium]
MAGGLLGLAGREHLPSTYKDLSQAAIGIGTLAMGVKMFLSTRNPLVPIGSLIVGELIGHLLGFQAGIEAFGAWAQAAIGGGEGFSAVFVATSILFCVGPMTLLGCLEDGLEGKIHLLGIKSALDGVSSVFFAAASGPGVLLSAGTVLAVQTPLTLGARRLRFLAEQRRILDEVTATGGLILIAIGLNLLDLKAIPTADFIPGLVLAGLAGWELGPSPSERRGEK